MQMNVAVELPVTVVHGVTFDLFAHAINFSGSGVAVYKIHLCPISDMHVT